MKISFFLMNLLFALVSVQPVFAINHQKAGGKIKSVVAFHGRNSTAAS